MSEIDTLIIAKKGQYNCGLCAAGPKNDLKPCHQCLLPSIATNLENISTKIDEL